MLEPGLFMAEAICVDGWPETQHLSGTDAQVLLRSHLDDVARSDLPDASEKRRDPARVVV